MNRGAFTRIAMTLGLTAAVCPLVSLGLPEEAMAAVDQTPLRLFNPHTQEKYDIQLFQGAQWSKMGILSCDWMMRDWRENQTVQCDRKLYAALYVIQRKYGVANPLSVNSGFRSVKTNAMLRGNSIKENGGVSWETPAVNSQHCRARAVDFVVPGVPPIHVAAYVELLALGGTGNYPTFTHMDTGSIRRWGPKP